MNTYFLLAIFLLGLIFLASFFTFSIVQYNKVAKKNRKDKFDLRHTYLFELQGLSKAERIIQLVLLGSSFVMLGVIILNYFIISSFPVTILSGIMFCLGLLGIFGSYYFSFVKYKLHLFSSILMVIALSFGFIFWGFGIMRDPDTSLNFVFPILLIIFGCLLLIPLLCPSLLKWNQLIKDEKGNYKRPKYVLLTILEFCGIMMELILALIFLLS